MHEILSQQKFLICSWKRSKIPKNHIFMEYLSSQSAATKCMCVCRACYESSEVSQYMTE